MYWRGLIRDNATIGTVHAQHTVFRNILAFALSKIFKQSQTSSDASVKRLNCCTISPIVCWRNDNRRRSSWIVPISHALNKNKFKQLNDKTELIRLILHTWPFKELTVAPYVVLIYKSLLKLFIATRQRSCWKVMFSYVSVRHSVQGDVTITQDALDLTV